MWMMRRIALASAIIGIIPVALAGLALILAGVIACPLTESTRPCLAFGADLSGAISWLLLVGVSSAIFLTPPAAAIVAGWAVIEIVNFIRSR